MKLRMETVRNPCGSARADAGFTLIELLIVVTIIMTLLVGAIMTYQMALNRSRVAACKVTLKNVQKGMEEYNAQNGDYPPAIADFNELSLTLKEFVSIPSSAYTCAFVSYEFTPQPVHYVLKAKVIYNIPGRGMNLTLSPNGLEEQAY